MSNKLYSPLIQDPVTKQFYKHELNTHTGIVLKTQQKFINNLIKERDQYKAERDTLIDDIAVLKANVSRLERENEKQESVIGQFVHDLQYAEWEIIPHLKSEHYKFCILKNHIRQKAEANPNVDRYIELVNYIDKLESD